MPIPHLRRFSPRHLVRARLTVGTVLGAVVATLFAVAPAQAADGQITGLAGKCVDVAGASSANGTAVQLYDCNGTNAQTWSNPGDGTLRALGKCLDIVDRGTADGAAVQLWDCAGTANQQRASLYRTAPDSVRLARRPSCITSTTFAGSPRTSMSASGSPSHTMRSAVFPGSTVPRVSSSPSS